MTRVLITRADAEPMAAMIRSRGAVPVHVPLLALTPTGAPPPTGVPDLVLVSSAATARLTPDLAQRLAGAPVVAVGKKTAAALEAAGITVDAVGARGGAAAVALLSERREALRAKSIWVVGAASLSPQLSAALAALDFAVARWTVYRTSVPEEAAGALAAALPVDVVTFASGSAARAFAERAKAGAARVAVIGPSTAEDARAAGLPVDALASAPRLEALVEAAISAGRAG